MKTSPHLALTSTPFLPTQQSFNTDSTDKPNLVNDKRHTIALASNNSNWIKNTQHKNIDTNHYSLITRTNYITIHTNKGYHANITGQYYTHSNPFSNNYLNSEVRVHNTINNWFNDRATTSTVDNLPTNSPLHNNTIKNNRANTLDTATTVTSLTNGFSKPTNNQIATGNNIAFAISCNGTTTFLSKTHFVKSMTAQTQTSNTIATINYGEITTPQIDYYTVQLRSPDDIIYSTASSLDYTDRVFQLHTDTSTNSEHKLVYPALWINSCIFETLYVAHHLRDTTQIIALDKTVKGQTINSSVTAHTIISTSIYATVMPTSVTKTLTAPVNEFTHHYKIQ